MTNEQFSREYHLLDRLSQGAVVTHHAQSATGAMVMVHFLRGSPEENAAVLRRVDALAAERRARVLAVVDVDGATALVTKFILDFTTLQDWLASGAAQPSQPVQEAPRVASAPDVPIAAPVPSAGPTAPASSPPAPAASSAGPGEFTRMFQNAAPPLAPHQPVASAPIETPMVAPTARPEPPVASPPRVSPAPSGAPGEFTLLFRGTPPAGAANPLEPRQEASPENPRPVAQTAPVAPLAPASPPPSPREAGEFTRMFGAPAPLADADLAPKSDPVAAPVQESVPRPHGAPPPSVPSDSMSAAPAEFNLPNSPPSYSPPSAPTFDSAWSGFSAPPAQPTAPPAGPGEYTRMFGNPGAPQVAPMPAPGSPTSGPPPMQWGATAGSSLSNTGDSYFERLAGGGAGAPPPPAPAHNLPPAPLPFAGPSEFTRIISAPPPTPALTPPTARPVAPPAPISVPSAQKSDRVLLFSLLGVVLLAVVLVAVFLIAT